MQSMYRDVSVYSLRRVAGQAVAVERDTKPHKINSQVASVARAIFCAFISVGVSVIVI